MLFRQVEVEFTPPADMLNLDTGRTTLPTRKMGWIVL